MQDNNKLTSTVNVLAELRKEGYTEEYLITEDKQMRAMDGKETYTPDQVRIVNFFRFEGESNPDDMSILYVLETDNGHKGTLTDAFGTYSDDTVESFMKQVKSMGKDMDSHAW